MQVLPARSSKICKAPVAPLPPALGPIRPRQVPFLPGDFDPSLQQVSKGPRASAYLKGQVKFTRRSHRPMGDNLSTAWAATKSTLPMTRPS